MIIFVVVFETTAIMAGKAIPIPLTGVACQDLITNRDVTHHGNLRRRRMLNNLAEKVNVKSLKLDQVFRWRQSYVVLMNGCIYIYNNEMSSKPARATSLYGFSGVEACDYEVSVNVSWPFKLVSALENKDYCYYFSAPSKKDMQTWIKCIQDQLSNIFKILDTQSSSASITSSAAEFRPSMGGSRPPLPPPRACLPGAEYIEVSDDDDDDDDDQLDYAEIIEEEMDEAKPAPSTLKSALQNRFSSILSPKEANRTQTSRSQTQTSRQSLPVPSDVCSNRQQKSIPPPPVKEKPSGLKNFAKSISAADDRKCNQDETMMTYVDAPCYMELESDVQLEQQSGIESEAFWNGQPQDADLIMRHIALNGAYMLRESSEKGSRTLLVRLGSSVVKYKIQVDEKGRLGLLTTGPYFDTMASLIAFYKKNPVPKHDLPLTLPYSAVEKSK